jgi:hypothetical protein
MSRESRQRAWLAKQARLKAQREMEKERDKPGATAASAPAPLQAALQSTLFWGCVAMAAAIVLAVVAAMIHDIRRVLIFAWPFAVFAVWEFARYFSNKKIVVRSTAGASVVIFGVLLGWLYSALAPATRDGRPLDEKLPGFGSGMMVQTNDNIEVRRKYQFEYRTPDGAKAAFYLSASDRYVFSVTDIHGQPYTLDIPLGSNGIPFGKWAYIFCEVGVASSYAYLRALVNGKEVARRDLDFPLDLGSRRWLGTLGADSDGKNGGSFSFTEFGVLSTTLNDNELMAQAKNALRFYGLDAKH